MSSLFVSDLHLSARGPETADLFVKFLAGPARDAQDLYILGDLFDYWLGDDDLADPFNERIRAALAALTAGGTAAYFLPGNRDFLVGDAFAAATGITLLPDISVHRIAGRPTLLLHGDTLCTDDHAYLRLSRPRAQPAVAARVSRPPAWRSAAPSSKHCASAAKTPRAARPTS